MDCFWTAQILKIRSAAALIRPQTSTAYLGHTQKFSSPALSCSSCLFQRYTITGSSPGAVGCEARTSKFFSVKSWCKELRKGSHLQCRATMKLYWYHRTHKQCWIFLNATYCPYLHTDKHRTLSLHFPPLTSRDGKWCYPAILDTNISWYDGLGNLPMYGLWILFDAGTLCVCLGHMANSVVNVGLVCLLGCLLTPYWIKYGKWREKFFHLAQG